MLLYNSNKEFIGIDDKDLKTLGFNNLASLRVEVSDFADLFVKTPGYIHNFKHVHWIDFITCADSSEESKAIINVNNKNFKCVMTIENLFLTDNPSAKAYIVYLNNLRELNSRESETISGDIVARPQPIVAPAFVAPEIEDDFDVIEESTPEVSHVQVDPYETPLEVNFDDEELLEEIEEIPETPDVEEQIQTDEEFDDMLDVGDLTFDEEEVPEPEHHMHETTQVANESFDNGYVYDPHVASNELGLPLDLIEEFIQDFIAQAKEFKADIYTALDHAEYEQVKILSHKLKGVAANLRIEDAFNSLSVVNTAEDSNIIRKNLDTFYKIIAKLAGEDIVVEKQLLVEDDDEEIAVDFKEESVESAEITPEVTLPDENLEEEDDLYGDLLDIEDSQVPEKIEIAELADDDYLGSDVNLNTIESEIDEIENIDLLELDKEIEESDDEPLKLELEEEVELETPSFIEEEVALPVIEYSKEKVAGEIGLDVESFNELFEDYISESGIIISEIKSALENHDYSACKHEAMKLKGMSDNMRINSFTHEVETLMRSNDEEETNQAIQKIEIIISEISKIGA